jgi:hypothetical protein
MHMAEQRHKAERGSPQVPPDAGQQEGINPLNPRSMPRAEDDEVTFARSPEYHDRPPADNPPAADEGHAITPRHERDARPDVHTRESTVR